MCVSPTCVVSEKGATEATLNVSLVAARGGNHWIRRKVCYMLRSCTYVQLSPLLQVPF
jgi:hypothetical protein